MMIDRAIDLASAAAIGGFLLIGAPVAAKTEAAVKVCGLHSSFLMAPGEKAQVTGAGADNVSMLVSGPGGSWIFYDGLASEADLAVPGEEVLRTGNRIANRRNFDPRIYVVRQLKEQRVNGKVVEAAAMGVDMMRQPLDRPAITGSSADLLVVDRLRPGEIGRCDLRWYPGKGLEPAG